MKSLGQHVLDTILEKKLITAKWHRDKGTWVVPHSHTADQIELAIKTYSETSGWTVATKDIVAFFKTKKEANEFARNNIGLGVKVSIYSSDENKTN